MMRIGLITDTHLPGQIRDLGELGQLPQEFLSSVDLIMHGGDLTSPIVLDWCEQFAPVICSTGNNDPIPDPRMKEVQILETEGWTIGMIHSLEGQFRPIKDLQKLFPKPVNIMISGHTHQERLEYREGVVLINSGSITFPQHKEVRLGTVGILEIESQKLKVDIFPLGETPGSPNPGSRLYLEMEEGIVVASKGDVLLPK
ncbi:MAG: metallophosphoesterase family protein [Chloroflexota bacterium]|jgi:putative phosphoesterase|nr:metallophosphoesterase family protein [Chloroflexota bacterium]MQF66052.1 metallophosphoesterase family protein [SAR202 cluster bacterium AC-647-P02_OGT_505m]|tara:strand:+ start:6218 stop:6817 length:600 start_codon:yes stop_codon:yes gene_type:complete